MFKRKYKSLVYYIAVVALLVLLHFLGLLLPLENLTTRIFKPALSFAYQSSSLIRSFYGRQTDRRDLSQVLDDLRKQVSRLTEENVRLKMIEEENAQLRNHLQFLSSKNKRYVMANVIAGAEANLVNQTYSIDKGGRNGLFAGLAVVNDQGQTVGKILSVKDDSSEICIINSSNCQFAVALQNKDKTIGIAKGDLGLTIKMEYIPQSEVVKVGDIVITSGLEKNISKGLVIGQISEVVKENNALWQTAKIESLSNLSESVIVSVVLP